MRKAETKLQKAVVRALGSDWRTNLEDVSNHGADAGYPGFTYTRDTVKFFRKNKNEILVHLMEMASDLGEDLLTMIKGFKCASHYSTTEIASVLFGNWKDDSTHDYLANCFAWYALESVAHEMVDD